MTTRTDIHAPAAAEFDPEAYDCWGVYDLNPDPMSGGESQKFRHEDVQRAKDAGYRFASHQNLWQCGHCGARIRYAALMVREDAHEMIYVGETCLDGRFELTKSEFDKLRKAAQLDREQQRLRVAFEALCDEHPALAYASYARNITLDPKIGAGWALSTLTDIARKARQYGDASAKQIAFVDRLFTEIAEKVTKAAQVVEEAPKGPIPAAGARHLIEGVVVSQKTVDSDFGVQFKMLVELDNGARLWGTEPSAISPTKGDRVRFVAKVAASNDDPSFGFFSRPTKPEVLQAVAA